MLTSKQSDKRERLKRSNENSWYVLYCSTLIERSLREVRRASHESNNTGSVGVSHHWQKFGFRLPLFTAPSNVFWQSFTFFFWKKNPCWNQIYFVESVLTDVWWMLQRIQAIKYSWIKLICELKLFCLWRFSFCCICCCSQPDLRLSRFFFFNYYFFHTVLSLEGSAVPLLPSPLQYAAASWEASKMNDF